MANDRKDLKRLEREHCLLERAEKAERELAAALEARREKIDAERIKTFETTAGQAMADAINRLVMRRVIDSRSQASDAALDWGAVNFDRIDRIERLERELAAAQEVIDAYDVVNDPRLAKLEEELVKVQGYRQELSVSLTIARHDLTTERHENSNVLAQWNQSELVRSDLERELAAAQEKLGDVAIVAVEDLLPTVRLRFNAFMEDGPCEGIDAKLWELMALAARKTG